MVFFVSGTIKTELHFYGNVGGCAYGGTGLRDSGPLSIYQVFYVTDSDLVTVIKDDREERRFKDN